MVVHVLADFVCQFDWAGDIPMTVKALLMGVNAKVFLEVISISVDRLNEENHTIVVGFTILFSGNPLGSLPYTVCLSRE